MCEGCLDGDSNVETGSRATEISFLPPATVPIHLILRVKVALFDQALGQTQSHGGIVGPLTWFQRERPTADQVGDRFEGARRLKLQGGTKRVANG